MNGRNLLIGDACTLVNGYAFKPTDWTDSGLPIIRIQNLNDVNAPFNYYDGAIDERYLVHSGDLLFSWSGTPGTSFGAFRWNRGDGVLNQHIFNVYPHEGIDYTFFQYALNSKLNVMISKAHGGVGLQHITKKELEAIQVFIPDLSTQRRIAATLDKVSEGIAVCRQMLADLDLLVKSQFVEMFESGKHPILTVEKLCSDIVDCPHTTPKYEGELKNPAIRTSEIKKGFLTWDSMKYVSDAEYEERVTRLRPQPGDIVYGREGSFGNAAILPSGYKFCLGQRVMLMRPNYSLCTSEYMLQAVISDSVYRQALESNNASTVAHVNVKDVKQFRIPLPSLTLQNQFAEFCKQHDKSKFVVQQQLTELETLKKSLMQEYFG